MSGGDRALDRFHSALERPSEAQGDVLFNRIIGPNRDCRFGRAHGFSEIRSISEYRRQVLIRDYETIRNEVRRMVEGESGVLVSEAVRHFFSTSGTTSDPKLIPVTGSLVREKSRAFSIYWENIRRTFPQSTKGLVVSNFSDASTFQQTSGGIPFSSESAYWAQWLRRSRGTDGVVPRCLLGIESADDRIYAIARVLLGSSFAVLMSLNPSTIVVVLEKINTHFDLLVQDITFGTMSCASELSFEAAEWCRRNLQPDSVRAADLRNLSQGGEGVRTAADLWSALDLMIAWKSPSVRSYAQQLRKLAGTVPTMDYITMASECIIAVPLDPDARGGVLAVGTHFYEFMPVHCADDRSAQTLLPEELEIGQKYLVIVSTSAGLYRYNIGDVVEVTGFSKSTPILEFQGRHGATSSVTGEKLTEPQVIGAALAAAASAGLSMTDFVVFPTDDRLPSYVLLMEMSNEVQAASMRTLARAFDQELSQRNIEYAAKRESLRLGSPEVWVAQVGEFAAWNERRIKAGASASQLKTAHLSNDSSFGSKIAVREKQRAR
ncbi:MAG: GH3 auxin-responsive promoter family protein [Planctomycetota bacterium]